jgi:murein DD-endopeptidase MepM/ murein hydrolase activator NlpD
VVLMQACASNTGNQTTSNAAKSASSSSSVNPVQSSQGGKLSLCQMKVSNAPPATGREIINFYPLVLVNGVQLMTAPVRGACLSSGFGRRGGRLHKGVDYHQRPAGSVFVAGDATVIEATYRKDYGNMIVLDHGSGVYTRYAHLDSFSKGIRVGEKVKSGEVMGRMGNSGRVRAVHLHYEILTGNYNNPKRSFGLQPRNPFKR